MDVLHALRIEGLREHRVEPRFAQGFAPPIQPEEVNGYFTSEAR